VDVIPVNTWTRGAFVGSSYSARFTVTNLDVVGHKYALGCDASTGVSCTAPYDSTPYMTAGQSWPFDASYSINVGASGTGYIQFTVNDHLKRGQVNFMIWPNVAHGVSVTPASGTGPNRGSFTNGYVASFTVRNVGTSSDTYTFSCQAPTNVTCGTVSPPSQVLASLDTTVVTVTYNVGATGSAYIGLQASNANASNTGRWNFSVVPSVGYAVAVTPDAKPIGVLTSTSASYPFTVRNTGTAQNTYTITASCSGAAIASGCTPSMTSATVPAGGTTAVSVSYASGGASTTGKITLTAKQTSDIAVKDTGWVNVATGTAQAPAVNVAGVNPGVTLERDLCLTVALSGGAATECGDLRLAHGLPAVRTMGRARAPTLVYSSAQAHPYPLVAAEVTLPAGAANPDSVEVVLHVGADSVRARWAGSAFSPGGANRLVIGWDRLNDSTGVYSYTLDVASIYPASRLSTSPAPSGELIVVNRSRSEFGAGWWLAGLERLRLDSMLWIGGDGSARVYRSAGSNVWFAAALDRPDTLKKVGTEYVRLLPAKAEVWFDVQGRHVRTVSRLKHDTTWFHRNASTGKLDSITVAPASQALRYKFAYNATSGLLDSVIAPPIGALRRATKLTKNGAQVTAIRDPDTSSVSFAYDAAYTNRVKSRTDRVGTVASYFFDAAGKVARDSLDPALAQPVIVTRVRPLESVGFLGSAARDTADAYALIDGPRTDVGDSTMLWLDRFGAPRRVRNALGQETLLARGNATFPALVTRVQAANGRVTTATYDGRGHVATSTDSGAVAVTGQPAVTRYAWNATWDAVTLIVPPERDSTVIGIDAATGHRVSQQDAGGNRADFTYYTTTGLLATAKEPGATAVMTLNYDARGNLKSTVSPLGIRDSVARDALGRDTLDVTPIDTTTTPRQYRLTKTWYNLADRVIQTQTTGPAIQYTLSSAPRDTTTITGDTLTVQNAYDREGRLTDVTTAERPTQTTTVDEHRTYDGAGRLLTKRLGSGPTTFTYDAAGNALTQRYGYGVVTATYDELNRVVRRVVPRRAYPHTDCLGHPNGPLTGTGTDCLITVPLYPNLAGDSVETPADTSVFGYDVAGNQMQADNRYAQVRRSFFPNGLLQRDTLRVRDYLDGAYGHVYALRYGYDGDGRRTRLFLPGGGDSLTYTYSPINGALAQVRDPTGHRYALTYTPAGRLDSLKAFPTASATIPGVKERRQYDADGRLVWRERRTGANALLQLDSLRVDLQGRVAQAATQSAALAHQGERTSTAYAGLGAVLASERVQTSNGVWEVEEFRPSGMGNVYYNHWRSQADSTSRRPQRSSFDAHGLLSWRRGDVAPGCNPQWYTDSLYQVGDAFPSAGGNVIRAGELHAVSGCAGYDAANQSATNSYYTLDNKLAVMQREDVRGDGGHGSWEEYWYDALGRRVLVLSRREYPLCTVGSNECFSFVQRTVWDGDQVLLEERTSGLDVVAGGAPNYGTVAYVHVGRIDQPVALLDGRVIHYNWRGLAEASSWADGSPADCELMTGNCTRIAWPAGQGVYYRRAVDLYAGQTITWIGSLPANGQDGTGQLYRRNRYYDPASGRFTQEDPIGLAGGLNLYGFAGGDPVNYSDPFGLCPPKDNVPCRDVTSEEGRKILHSAAETGQWTWTEGKEGQIPKDVPNHVGDCTDFCETAQENSGLPALDPRPSTGEFAGSSDFRPLGAGEKPQMGDVVVDNGHAGISTGQVDKQGRPRALQNGQHGTRVIPFDKDAKIYRRQVPDSP
jgi:RHS repeat-associated protein